MMMSAPAKSWRDGASGISRLDRGPVDFSELLLVPGVRARTVRARHGEVVHGAPYRFTFCAADDGERLSERLILVEGLQ